MNATKTYETLEQAAMAMLLKKEPNMWRIYRTTTGKYALRMASR